MAKDDGYTAEQLAAMSRRELQALAKATQACKANAKTSAIVSALAAHYEAQAGANEPEVAAAATPTQAPSEGADATDDQNEDVPVPEPEEQPAEQAHNGEVADAGAGCGDSEAVQEKEDLEEEAAEEEQQQEEEQEGEPTVASPASIFSEKEGAGVTVEAAQSPAKAPQRPATVAPVAAAPPAAAAAAPRPKPTHSNDLRPRVTPKAQGFKTRYSHVRAKVSTGRASATSASRSATRPTPTSGGMRGHSRKSFDLAASLRRKPTWKLKKGRVQPLEVAEEDKRAQRPTIGTVRPRSALGSRNVNQAGAPSAKAATVRGSAARQSIYGR